MAGRLSDTGDDLVENHEINVTPFIDVMLVLLIIFMVAAPLSTVDVPVDLPVAKAKPQQRQKKPVFLTIKADLTLALGNDPVAATQLASMLDTATGSDRKQRIFLRADKAVPYGRIMETMNHLRAAGYLKIAMVGLDAASAPPEQPATAGPRASQ
jgi:biopolymer transport protein ExbD